MKCQYINTQEYKIENAEKIDLYTLLVHNVDGCSVSSYKCNLTVLWREIPCFFVTI